MRWKERMNEWMDGWKRKHIQNEIDTIHIYSIEFLMLLLCVKKEGHREILICTSTFARLFVRPIGRSVGWLAVLSLASIYTTTRFSFTRSRALFCSLSLSLSIANTHSKTDSNGQYNTLHAIRIFILYVQSK